MQDRTKKIVGSMAAACWIAVFAAVTAHAGNNETVATWLGTDPNADWVTVDVRFQGRGVDKARLQDNTKATFSIRLSDTELGATTVLIDDEASELSAIPEGEIVHIVWRPIDGSEYGMFATKIVYLTEAAIEARKKAAAESKDSGE